jgi:uridine kinase
VRARLDVKLFVDTDPDIRLMRRVRRDIEQRGRTFAQVRQQYYETVRPMHIAFVEPSKRFADIIIPEGGENLVAREMILALMQKFLRERVPTV